MPSLVKLRFFSFSQVNKTCLLELFKSLVGGEFSAHDAAADVRALARVADASGSTSSNLHVPQIFSYAVGHS